MKIYEEITSIVAWGGKFTEKLLDLREKEVARKLEAYKDEQEAEKENAEIEYERLLHSLACLNVDYQEALSAMVECKQRIADADATLEAIEEIEAELNAEVDEEPIKA